ncbi:MAG: hypothetical protein HYS98_00775 [Deltaproteobacteria bacterium]|nr:hypothetical protein [Deltaproteobacteria bacterium]
MLESHSLATPAQDTGSIQLGLHITAGKKSFEESVDSLLAKLELIVRSRIKDLFKLNLSTKKHIVLLLEGIGERLWNNKLKVELSEEWFYESDEHKKTLDTYLQQVVHFYFAKLCLMKLLVQKGVLHQNSPFQLSQTSLSKLLCSFQTNLVFYKQTWLFSKQHPFSWLKLSDEELLQLIDEIEQSEIIDGDENKILAVYDHYLRKGPSAPVCQWGKSYLKNIFKDLIWVRHIEQFQKPMKVLNLCASSGFFLSLVSADFKRKHDTDIFHAFISQNYYALETDYYSFLFLEMSYLWEYAALSCVSQISYGNVLHYDALRTFANPSLLDNLENPVLSSKDELALIQNPKGIQKRLFQELLSSKKMDYCLMDLSSISEFSAKEYALEHPEWKSFYESKLHMSSWYYILGLSKLREDGILIAFDQEFWPTAEGASKLRGFVLDQAKILEVYDFGTKITPKYLYVLQKCSQKEFRDLHCPQIIRLQSDIGTVEAAELRKQVLDLKNSSDVYVKDGVEIFLSALDQGQLTQNVWNSFQRFKELPLLERLQTRSVSLDEFFIVRKPQSQDGIQGTLLTAIPEQKICLKDNQFYDSVVEEPHLEIIPRIHHSLSLKFVCLLLHSKIIQFWSLNQGVGQGRGWREKDLKHVPLPKLSLLEDKGLKLQRQHQYYQALMRCDFNYLRAGLFLELKSGNHETVIKTLECFYDEIQRRKAVNQKYDFLKSEEVPWHAYKDIFPQSSQCVLKNHPQIFVKNDGEASQFCFLKARMAQHPDNQRTYLQLISMDNKFLSIDADDVYLSLIQSSLDGRENLFWDEIEEIITLPQDLSSFLSFCQAIWAERSHTEKQICEMIQVADEIIFRCYGFDPDQEDISLSSQAVSDIKLMNSLV